MTKTLMGVLREQFFVQLIHTDSKDNQPFFTFLQYYYLPLTDIDNLCDCCRKNEKNRTCIGCRELAIETIL